MNCADAIACKHRIEYQTGGVWYKLEDAYPIWMRVKDKPDQIYFDTGGPMAFGSFFVAELRDDGWMYEIRPRVKEPIKMRNQWRLANGSTKS